MLGFKYVYWCIVTTCFIFFPFFLFYLMVVQVHLKVTEHTVISVYYFILTKHYRILWTKCSIVSGSALAKSPQIIIMLFQFDTCIYALLMISRSQFMIENWEKKSMLLPMEIDRCINYQSDSHECFIINTYQ